MNKYMKPNRSEPKKSKGDYLWEWIQVAGWLFVLGMIYSMACKGKARAEGGYWGVNASDKELKRPQPVSNETCDQRVPCRTAIVEVFK
jgi:hypothetical protein